MIENDKVIIVNGKEMAALMLDMDTISNNRWEGEFSEPYILVGVVGYYKGKVVIHRE